jgi:perosamine synthetase
MKNPDWLTKIKTPKVKGRNKIPIYAPLLIGKEKEYLMQCIDDAWLSSKGTFVTKYETKLAEFCGVPYVVSCSSGTAALRLALHIIGVKRNDEVIVPTFTMVSSAIAVSYFGAKPVFADCNENDGVIHVGQLEKLITKKTKAIMPVDIYGTPCDIDSLQKLAKTYGIPILEDAAEAFGSEYKGKKVGSLSEYSAFSTYINKVITTGEGGFIALKSREKYHELKRLNNYYFSSKRHFWHEKIGYNFKLSNMQAAVGLAQLENVGMVLQNKKNLAQWYNNCLKEINDDFSPLTSLSYAKGNHWHIAYRLLKNPERLMDLRNYLGDHGIETRGFFIPMHLQPIYRNSRYAGKFPVAEKLAQSGVLLPSGPGLQKTDIERICTHILEFLKRT